MSSKYSTGATGVRAVGLAVPARPEVVATREARQAVLTAGPWEVDFERWAMTSA
jgi:hypothetical protein